MRIFNDYAYFSNLQNDEKEGFDRLKSEKPEYISSVIKILSEKWDKLPKKEYHSKYPSRTNPGHMITLKREHVFFIFHVDRVSEPVSGGLITVHETDIVFFKDNFCKLVKRTDMCDGWARMSFRMHKLSDERMLTILKKDSVFRKLIERINQVS